MGRHTPPNICFRRCVPRHGMGHAAAQWIALHDTAATGATVFGILNPASGPGTVTAENYTATIDYVKGAGAKVCSGGGRGVGLATHATVFLTPLQCQNGDPCRVGGVGGGGAIRFLICTTDAKSWSVPLLWCVHCRRQHHLRCSRLKTLIFTNFLCDVCVYPVAEFHMQWCMS